MAYGEIHTETATFPMGARVVRADRPGGILTVFSTRDGMVFAGRSPRDYVAAPAASFVLAPEGYRAPPNEPAGSAAAGLSELDRQAKAAADAADLGYQHKLRDYHASMIAWATVHAARVNRGFSAEVVRAQDFLLSRCLDRLAGRDPDDVDAARAA